MQNHLGVFDILETNEDTNKFPCMKIFIIPPLCIFPIWATSQEVDHFSSLHFILAYAQLVKNRSYSQIWINIPWWLMITLIVVSNVALLYQWYRAKKKRLEVYDSDGDENSEVGQIRDTDQPFYTSVQRLSQFV